MSPTTSFETYLRAIQQKTNDAIAFVNQKSPEDARRLNDEIAAMDFGGVTMRERLQLIISAEKAREAIGRLLEGRAA